MAEPITQVLGVVSIKNRGAYDSEAQYEKLNVVTYQGSSYCAKTSVQGVLPTNTEYWDLMAEKGDTGETGEDGYTPVKGVDYYTAADKAELEATLASDVSDEVSGQLSTLTSATPLAASSTAGMIDTTRIYVNTTDGHWYWYDGEDWQDGGVYQAAEDSTTVDELVIEVNNINDILDTHISYISNSDLSIGYYSLNDNGTINTNNSNTGYKKVKIENLPAGTYKIKKCRSVFTIIEDLVSEVNSKLSNTDNLYSGDVVLTHTSNLYVTTSGDINDCLLVSSGDDIPEYVTEKGAYSYEIESIKNHHTFVVDINGNGDYTSLKECIEQAIKFNGSIVKVKAGTYDLISEFGATYFENLGQVGKSGIKLGNDIHIIFDSNAKVTCNYTGNNNNVKIYFSPFNLLDNTSGYTLENLNLECSNVRYAIHDEANSTQKAYTNKYINCRIYIDNRNNNVWNPRQCIGGGLGAGNITITGCYFESEPKNGNTEDIVSYHNGNGNHCQSNIVINDCYFANGDGCRCSYYGSQTVVSHMMVANCSLGKEPRIIAETSGSTTVNMELIKWNNEIRSS